jgi:hypothetical protein
MHQGVVEVATEEPERPASPDGWLGSLELLELDEDTGVPQSSERAVDPMLGHEVTDIVQFAAGGLEELAVRATRVAEHGSLEHRQEGGLAPFETARDDPMCLLGSDRLGEEARQPSPEAGEAHEQGEARSDAHPGRYRRK